MRVFNCPNCRAGAEFFVASNENASTCSKCGLVVDDQNYSYMDAAVHEPEDVSNKRGEIKNRTFADPLMEAVFSDRTRVPGEGGRRLKLRDQTPLSAAVAAAAAANKKVTGAAANGAENGDDDGNGAAGAAGSGELSQVEQVKKSRDTYRRYCGELKTVATNLGLGEAIVTLAQEKFLHAATWRKQGDVRKKYNARGLEALVLVALYHVSRENSVSREIGEVISTAKDSVGWEVSSRLFSRAIKVYAQMRTEKAAAMPTHQQQQQQNHSGSTSVSHHHHHHHHHHQEDNKPVDRSGHGISEGKAEFTRRVCSDLKWSSKATAEAARCARLLSYHYSSHKAGTVAAAALIQTQKKFPKEPGTEDEICDICGVGKQTVLKMLKDQEALKGSENQ